MRELALSRVAKSMGAKSIIGYGGEQIVMADGPDVVKILFGTIHSDKGRVTDEADKLQVDADTCQSYLLDYWLPTTFEPLALANGKSFAVIARQERLLHPNFFTSSSQVKDSAELRTVAGNILSLQEDTGLFPDIIGPDNIALRLGDGGLCQIDTIPVKEEVLLGVAKNGQDFTNRELLRQQAINWLQA
jgi:hypothetical protein